METRAYYIKTHHSSKKKKKQLRDHSSSQICSTQKNTAQLARCPSNHLFPGVHLQELLGGQTTITIGILRDVRWEQNLIETGESVRPWFVMKTC